MIVRSRTEQTGKEVLQSEFLARIVDQTAGIDRQPTGNPHRSALKLEVEPRISNGKFTGAGETPWFLFAGPQDGPAVVGFLDGRKVPTTEFFGYDADPNYLGVKYRAYHDFGFALGDPKAGVKNAGA